MKSAIISPIAAAATNSFASHFKEPASHKQKSAHFVQVLNACSR